MSACREQHSWRLIGHKPYKKPKILFLHEATSHLDVRLEEQINDIISQINITRIIIAHRPQTIAMADEIYQLQNKQLIKDKSIRKTATLPGYNINNGGE